MFIYNRYVIDTSIPVARDQHQPTPDGADGDDARATRAFRVAATERGYLLVCWFRKQRLCHRDARSVCVCRVVLPSRSLPSVFAVHPVRKVSWPISCPGDIFSTVLHSRFAPKRRN